MGLDGSIDHGQRHRRDGDLGHGNLLHCSLSISFINHVRCVKNEEAGCVNFDTRTGDPFEDNTVGGELGAEGGTVGVIDTGDEVLKGFLSLV